MWVTFLYARIPYCWTISFELADEVCNLDCTAVSVMDKLFLMTLFLSYLESNT